MPAYKPGIEERAMNVIGDDGWMFMITGRAVVFCRVERTSIQQLPDSLSTGATRC